MAFINFVRDYERVARFRLGTFEGMMGPGIVISLPIIHQIQKIDTRTTVLDIPRQTNITKDNAPIEIDFLVYLRVDINEAQKAVLEVEDYTTAVVGLATTTLRAVIGEMNLDDVFSQRDKINEVLRTRLDSETERWGIKVTNVEIREIDPPRDIQEAMNRQMTAERIRRAVVLEADGTKQAAITVAEGEKQSSILKAEGDRQAEILAAEGDQQATVLRASGYAEALAAIHKVASGVDANTMTLQYVDALKELAAGESTKFVLPLELTKMLGGLGSFTSQDD
ncbi:MAG: SPFH/Band 7/PHB domain protein [Chloroflexi bacterium]|jgi:regulator of protease activity HflC (stomatin/prohibitin superfamily)|nr:SPFH/Band 7/PHB domain protein [Chloroflexota bacterium]MBT3862146.1 SPFH/Band 7/PHB domain protein [Chloroflexota bacterium]MBT4340720.1 SPFH/Band 7/PHB domain protein [Chloroflexota bacterium]MBT4942946.1 SPFH/Band 7/PHB domain protein [Chloroflexota bacterium]MBT5252779.1 SPFH/Band 7/PHB domain protein [Chloroflexota bacterium]